MSALRRLGEHLLLALSCHIRVSHRMRKREYNVISLLSSNGIWSIFSTEPQRFSVLNDAFLRETQCLSCMRINIMYGLRSVILLISQTNIALQ